MIELYCNFFDKLTVINPFYNGTFLQYTYVPLGTVTVLVRTSTVLSTCTVLAVHTGIKYPVPSTYVLVILLYSNMNTGMYSYVLSTSISHGIGVIF